MAYSMGQGRWETAKILAQIGRFYGRNGRFPMIGVVMGKWPKMPEIWYFPDDWGCYGEMTEFLIF